MGGRWACGQSHRAGEGNHGAIVGTELGFREIHPHPTIGLRVCELFSQETVCADPTGNDQCSVAGRGECTQGFGDEHFDDGCLYRSSKVGPILGLVQAALDMRGDGSFESAE
jgi:hypothetical protein